jgi:hypothetical protein
MSSSGNSGGSSSNNTPDTNSSSDSSSWFTGGAGVGMALGGVIIVILIIYAMSAYEPLRAYTGYAVSTFVGSASLKFFDFLPLIFIVLGLLMDAINAEFQASKISIASLVIPIGQIGLGGLWGLYQSFANTRMGVSTLDTENIWELIPGFLDSCRVTLFGFNVNPTNYGQTSNYSLVTFFISFCYLISLAIVNINNPNYQYMTNWWVGPIVMIVLSILGLIVRINRQNSCDSLITSVYGISFAAIWAAAYLGISYGFAHIMMPFSNKIFAQSEGTILPGSVKPNTNQSCAAPQGEGVVYEIYQDGEMVGQV